MKKLYFGDCLDVLKELHKQNPEGFIDLVYIDPPFNSKRNYNVLFESIDMTDTKAQKEAFADTWSNVSYIDTINEIKELDLDLYEFLKALDKINISKSAVSYLTTMTIRIYYIHKVLKKTGSFYLHCDPTMSHYLKLVCDLIFNQKNFLNDIIWSYHRWTNNVGAFISTHDNILFYCKDYKKHKFSQLKESFSQKSKHPASRVSVAEKGKVISQAYTEDTSREKAMRDVWEISYLNSQAKERLGYPTQKPEELLERIIMASSNENDLIADFFCGCGTTIAVADRLKRKWIGVDISHLAIRLVFNRLIKSCSKKEKEKIRKEVELNGFPKDIASAKELAERTEKGRFNFQDWIVEVMLGGIVNSKHTADGGWDGYITFNKTEKERGSVLIEVKSGNVTVKNIREFIQVIGKREADIGIFVCFREQVTKEMEREAKEQGYFDSKNYGSRIPKIQILTVDDLLEGKSMILPESFYRRTTFKEAIEKEESESKQIDIKFKE